MNRELLELKIASGAVSYKDSSSNFSGDHRPLNVDPDIGLTSLAGAELERLTDVLSRQRRLAATKDVTVWHPVTLTNIVPRFEESECVEFVPLELADMDLNDVEQVSKWMYH